MKIENLKAGQIVYDVHSHRMGNTTIRTMGCWTVRIIEVNLDEGRVTFSWNGNPPETRRGREFSWRKNKPLMIRSRMGYQRLATRAEIKAAKEAQCSRP